MSTRVHSIQGRLLTLLLAGTILVWLATALVTWRDVRHELDELLDAHLAQAAALLVVQQAGEIETEDHRTLDAPSLHRYAPRAVFQVFHEDRLVLRSPDAPPQPLLAGDAAGFATVAADGKAWRVFAARGAEHDVRVFVGERIDAREHILRAALWGTLWPLGLTLPLLALLAWWAVRRGLAPLRTLGAQVAARPAHADDAVTLADAPAEVTPLLDALNGLLGRIETMLQAERRFTADAAHELRTPIAAIRAQAQVALSAIDDAQRHAALHATLQGCDRAAHLVDQLLMLSRLEAGASVAREAVDLAALARAVMAELAPWAVARQQVLGLDATDACTIDGDPTLLAVLLRNLIDNALRYSPPGARIAVELRRQADGVRLAIEDSGPGIADDRQAQLGQRFQRGLGHDESGSGLGWSIVRRIAEAHGFEVLLGRSLALGGLAVTLVARAPPSS
jgi:two-component system sensor histidine kinase QseC